jgi:hypothetical protein
MSGRLAAPNALRVMRALMALTATVIMAMIHA